MSQQTLTSIIQKTELIDWKKLDFIQDENFKEWIDGGNQKLIDSILKYQFADPFKVWSDGQKLYCLDGKHRYLDLLKIEEQGIEVPKLLPATFIQCASKKDAAELVLVYSSRYAKITNQGLFDFTQTYDIDLPELSTINLPDFDPIEFSNLFDSEDGSSEKDFEPKSIKEDFIITPFSILDTRTGDWLERKRNWQSLGFNSQESREDVELIAKSGQSPKVYELRNKMRKALKREPSWDEIIDYAKKKKVHIFEGASIFDPVLTELCYSWFCPEGGRILDPFAGGSVRGIVAGKLGFEYFGIDLRADQVEANFKQAEKLDLYDVKWQTGDSNKVLDEVEYECDFVFSCPPYADLEVYSDDPDDLSNMEYDKFLEVYNSIIEKSIQNLKDNSFACFVVGDVRDKQGLYRNFVSHTIEAFENAGAHLYNEIILINSIGSMAIRLRKQFNASRKVGKIHQNVLVFYKGDPKKIKEKYPELNLGNDLDNKDMQPNIEL